MRAKTVMTIKYQEWIEPEETTSDCPGALLGCRELRRQKQRGVL